MFNLEFLIRFNSDGKNVNVCTNAKSVMFLYASKTLNWLYVRLAKNAGQEFNPSCAQLANTVIRPRSRSHDRYTAGPPEREPRIRSPHEFSLLRALPIYSIPERQDDLRVVTRRL